MVPTAVSAGAMPALTREALHGEGPVRRRSAATLALLAAPAAIGLALVAPAVASLLLGRGSTPAECSVTALALRVMAGALPALFLNALLAAALIAAGRARFLPWLTAARVALAFALAFALVPRLGVAGAATGLVAAEWALLLAGRIACRRAAFAVPLGPPLAWALVASVPMALAVSGLAGSLLLALAVGGLTWVATLAATLRLAPGLVRRLVGVFRYP
jgi:O-antigen/teichoic acid export membrane protein